MENSELIKIRGRNFVCQLCDIKITSEQAVDDHLGGKKHQRLLTFRDSRQQQAERSVFVGGLCRLNGELELADYFSKFGEIAQIIIDKDKAHYAIVEFTTASSAKQATEVERQVMNGRKIVVRPREPKTVQPQSQQSKKKDAQRTGNAKGKKQPETHKLNETLYQGLLQEDTVSAQLTSLVTLTQLTEADSKLRHLICDLLQSVLEEFLPGCHITPFGSSVNGFGTQGCDLDIHLGLDESGIEQSKTLESTNRVAEIDLASASPLDVLCLISDVIKRCVPSCHNVHTIPSARLPVVKFTHKESGLHCDVSMNNRFALQNTKLLQFYRHLEPRVRPLVFAIRHWGKVHQLAGNVGAGPRLTNYALTLMVLFYLQAKDNPIIPSVDDLNFSGGGCDSVFSCDESNPTTGNTQTLGDILTGFFEFYKSFDFVTTVIRPLSGKTASLAEVLQSAEGFRSGEINIQDPFELWHNVALNVNEKTAKKLSAEMSTAATVCRTVMRGGKGSSEDEPWGFLVLLDSDHVAPQIKPAATSSRSSTGTTAEEVCVKINLKSSHLSERFVMQHSDPDELKSAWCDGVKNLAYRVLQDTLKFDCSWMSDDSKEEWNTEKEKESSCGSIADNFKTFITKEEDCGGVTVPDTPEASKSPTEGAVDGTSDGSKSPPRKRCKILSSEEDSLHRVLVKQFNENTEQEVVNSPTCGGVPDTPEALTSPPEGAVYGTGDGTGDGSESSRCKTISFGEDSLYPVSDKQSNENTKWEVGNSPTCSHIWYSGAEILQCTAYHPIWLGRRKARRKLLQSRCLTEDTCFKPVIDMGQATKEDKEACTVAMDLDAMVAKGITTTSTKECKGSDQALGTSSDDSEVGNRMPKSQTASQDSEDFLLLESQVTSAIISETPGGTSSSPLLSFSLQVTDKMNDGATSITMHFVPEIADTNFKLFLHFFDMLFRKILDQVKI